MDSEHKRILILGIGNILLGDEGIGVHAIKYLEQQQLPDFVDLLDGGTGGFYILSVLETYKTIIMIDATLDDLPTGTLNLIEPKFASDFPKALSSHEIGLKDLIESAALLNHLPKIYLITVSVKEIQDISLELSPELSEIFPELYHTITEILKGFE
jgi:hydrogenase maturation protease